MVPLPHLGTITPSFVQPNPTLALFTPNTVGHRPSEWLCAQHLNPPILTDAPVPESLLFPVFRNFGD